MASSNNQNAPNVPAPDMEKVLTKSGEPQGAKLVVKPPAEVPMGQEVRYAAVLKLNYKPADFDKWFHFRATAWAVNEADHEKQLKLDGTVVPIPPAYPIDIPGEPEKAWCITFSQLVFPEEGTFRLHFRVIGLKEQKSALPEGTPNDPKSGDAGLVISEPITVKKVGGKLRKAPEDWTDEKERVILTAIESYKPPFLGIMPTIFVKLSKEEEEVLEGYKKNAGQAK